MVCCIDTSNIFFITWSVFKNDCLEKYGSDYVIQEKDLGLFYHMFLRKIMDYLTTYKDVVLCFEGLHSTAWRKSIWPPYKENRKHDDPNYKWVGPLMENLSELLKNFHTKVLKVENCEGDDCIYQTCKYYAEQGEEVKIISNDKDLSQMMNYYDTVTQYNPIKKEEIQPNKDILLEKALVGDSSDNIKAFARLGPKTFEKMMADPVLYNKKMTPENLQILDKVMKIIDLRQYPQEYQDAIKTELDKPWNELNVENIEKFFFENNLQECDRAWNSTWLPDIQMLNFEQPDSFDEIEEIINS